MYPVSTSYKSKIKELTRVFKAQLQIQHSLGVLDLTDADIVGGSLAYTEASQAGEDFTIGGVVASDLSVEILNKPEYATYNFMGATVLVSIGLEVSPDTYEYVPLGVFNVDDVGKTRNAITLKALDNMIKFDKSYSMSNLIYPANLLQIFNDACTVCGVTPGTATFLNSDYVVQERPEGDLTFRDILSYVAELSGSFARCNRTGAVELAWYIPTGLTLTGANRFDFRPSDDLISIKGVMATVGDTTYLAGSDEYAVDLTHNPLLQSNHQTVLASVFNAIKDASFYPYESSWQGNPAIQAGDMLIQIDRDGKQWPAIVTSSTYKYRGSSVLKAQGLPVTAKGFKGSTNKKITNIVRAAQKETEIKLTTLEQAQLNATELVANMLGGHAIRRDDAFYIADNPNLDAATKVWKWGVGGFGYSSTGVGGPYNTAITADGSIVAMLVAANIVTADMVKTGILQSEDGSTVINLDDGSFNFKDAIKWEGDELFITGLTGLLEENKQYGAVVISALKGLQVLDDLNKERVRLGRFEALGEQTATFSRASTAYNPETGAVVAVNEPRFVDGPFSGSKALFVEEGTTNLIPPAYHDFQGGAWYAYSGAIATVTGGQLDPYGGNNAYRIQTNGGTHILKYLGHWYPDPAFVLGDHSAQSIWIKVLNGSVIVRNQEATASATYTPLDGWVHSELIGAYVDGAACQIQFRAASAGDSLDFVVYRPQKEKKPYATSFHPGTRSPENTTIPTAGVLNPQEGTWEQWVYIGEHQRRLEENYIFYIPRSGAAEEGIALYHNDATQTWQMVTRNDAGAASSGTTPDSHTPDGWHLFRVTWSTAKAELRIDGVPRITIPNPNLPSGFAANAFVGHKEGGTGYLNTAHADIRLSSIARTDDSDLVSYQSGEPLPLDGDTTYLMRMDGNLQPTEGGAYGLLVRDKSGQKTILDENGILQTWQEGRADNVESGKPLVLSVFLPSETRQVNKAILRFKRQRFRAYERAAASGGGATSGASSASTTASGGGATSGSSSKTTTASGGNHRHQMFYNYGSTSAPTSSWREFRAYTSIGGGTVISVKAGSDSYTDPFTYSADGDHVHDMQHVHTVPNHAHGMEHTHTVPAHTHPLEFGIYEGALSSNVTVKINGVDRTAVLGGGAGFDVDKDNLDVTPYLQTGQWNVIELGSGTLGRIDSTVFIQALMGVS